MTDFPTKHHFVLIHGMRGGAWCWYKIHTLLESSGHQVTSLDLKGSGVNPTDPNTVSTFEDYNQPLTDLFGNLPDKEQVILVTHSAGGLSVTDAIHKYGCRKIKMVIYVAAAMLKHGFATPEDVKAGLPDLSEYGEVNEYIYGLGPDQPPTGFLMKPEFPRKLEYNMTPDEEYTLVTLLQRPGSARAFQGYQIIEGEDADRVLRVYIKTLCDKIVKPEQQDAMISMWPPSLVFALEKSDHSAFLSAPSELGQFLLRAVASLD